MFEKEKAASIFYKMRFLIGEVTRGNNRKAAHVIEDAIQRREECRFRHIKLNRGRTTHCLLTKREWVRGKKRRKKGREKERKFEKEKKKRVGG